MSLLSAIANALGCNLGSITEAFGGYVIDDLCTAQPAPRTILLLESPHTDEKNAGHPLVGKSGKFVTNALRRNKLIGTELDRLGSEDREAIGCILQRHPQTLRLGLMNSSRLPLQIEAYHDGNWQLYGEFLCFLEMLKCRPELLLVKSTNRLSRILLNDLKSRLERLPKGALVVPCGKVARAFVKGVGNLEGYQDTAQIYDQEIPHPSLGHWERNENKEVVDQLLDIIAQASWRFSAAHRGLTNR